MTWIEIREQEAITGGFRATVRFAGAGEHSTTIRDPFSDRQEEELEWYFERHLRYPFLDQARAEKAGRSIRSYGEALFKQVFEDKRAFARYHTALHEGGAGSLRFIIAGSPEFHGLHWEALWDPKLSKPFSIEAPMVRQNLIPQYIEAKIRPSPTINLLLVTARPFGARDVGFRTISRPLIKCLRQTDVPVQVDLLRPGTYMALERHLQAVRDRHGVGYYHVVHFDVHGQLLDYKGFLNKDREISPSGLFQTHPGRPDLPPYEGLKAFIFLEADKVDYDQIGLADPVEAKVLADLLNQHQVPIVVLNACQSGKQVGATETSLGSRLVQEGIQVVLAMRYSITVSAAEALMRNLYGKLFENVTFDTAFRHGRLELFNRKGRRAAFSQIVDLEDWLLPVIYQNREITLEVREATADEHSQRYEEQGKYFALSEPTYGFWGRDVDILQIERRLLQHNLLLIRGMGGAGKTTLLNHLGSWWQITNFVDQVFTFAYDERAWTCEQLLFEIAKKLFQPAELDARFRPLGRVAQRAFLCERLRARRHVLILDNLESIVGTHFAIRHILPPEEREALRELLAGLRGGKTLVLLGSRSAEDWLAKETFERNTYDLPGLDQEAASSLAVAVLERLGAEHHRKDRDLEKLLEILGGFPLAIQVVLSNLSHQSPAQVLKAIQKGGVLLKTGDSQEKTENILRCIEYSHSNLPQETQDLLLCLAPFTGIFNRALIPPYADLLRQMPPLSHLPFDRLDSSVQEAVDCGLLAAHGAPNVLTLQPTFPYFLRLRLNEPRKAAARNAIENAFRILYDEFGRECRESLESTDSQQRQVGEMVVELEYENLSTALQFAVTAKESVINLFLPLLDVTRSYDQALELGARVYESLKAYPDEQLKGPMGFELLNVINSNALFRLRHREYAEAEALYHESLGMAGDLQSLSAGDRSRAQALVYHQLGISALQQNRLPEARRYHQQALKIAVEQDDRPFQARSHHELGIVAFSQHQLEEATRGFEKALEIKIELGDRRSQATTLNMLASIAKDQQRLNEAERYYKEALEIKIEFNELQSLATTYGALGELAIARRDWRAADHYYKKAMEIEIEIGNLPGQAGIYHSLGTIAHGEGRLAQAESYFKKALAIKQELQDPQSQASTYAELGKIAQDLRNWELAEAHLKKALQYLAEHGDRLEQSRVFYHLGIVSEEQGRWSEAEDYYKQTLQIEIEHNDRLGQAGTLHTLGLLTENPQRAWKGGPKSWRKEREKGWQEAKNYYRQVLEILAENDNRHLRALTCHSLGNLAFAQHSWEEAESYYEQALAIKTESGESHSAALTLLQLGCLAHDRGKWLEAKGYLLDALKILSDYEDEHHFGVAVAHLRQLGEASGDVTILSNIARVLRLPRSEVEKQLAGGDRGGLWRLAQRLEVENRGGENQGDSR